MDSTDIEIKVARIDLTTFRIPFRQPFATARGAVAVREGALVRVETAGGAYGWGEASFLPHETGRLDALAAALDRLARLALGQDVTMLAWGEARTAAGTGESLRLRDQNDGSARGAERVALAGIATAAADALARARGVPLARLLNPDAAAAVSVNAVIGADAVDQVVATARAAIEAGFRTVKLKVGVADTVEEEAHRVAAVREAIGPDVKLRLDANGAWTEVRAIETLNALVRYDIEYVEQPVAADDIEALKRVRDAVAMPIAADEAVTDAESARRIIEAGAAQVLILKPIQLGGLWATYRIAQGARAAGADAVVTTSIDSSVGLAAALHLAATLGGVYAAGLATASLLTSTMTELSLALQDGCMALPAGPGLGIEVDARELASCAVRTWEVRA